MANSRSWLIAFLLTLVAALDVTDLFNVKFGANDPGTCLDAGKDQLNNFITESIALAQAGIALCDAYENTDNELNPEATRLAESVFREPDEDDIESIRSQYEKVLSWLQNGGSTNGGRTTLKPFLFCGDSWTIRKSMSDILLGADGQPVLNEDGNQMKISDSEQMVEWRDDAEAIYGVATYPYWSDPLVQYWFGKKYGDSPTDGPCTTDGLYATTWTPATGPSYMSLCQASWTDPKELTVVDSYTIADVSKILDGSAFETAGWIWDVMPTSGTIFHELFHLVLGKEDSVPSGLNGQEVYGFPEVAGQVPFNDAGDYMDASLAIDNPETYTYAAVAFWTTQNAPLVYGQSQEFWTGYATHQN
ncbi:hypothetical protein BKA67DRAFT_694491 [Truncatella angustata]|uniref:Uncharacterized protein n=1 Tax=Truncatella angustata TaxID=152316 RepID=A0A9P8UCH2_9PEZI|nr:uncharacterized protein BKA67DRAFT_694491 [Truncatella angustata]KAH6647434.1 hypothetical protein BKA67DRAFT_694491 [Truncatella angustata]